MASKDPLDRYRAKRDSSRTPEPGVEPARSPESPLKNKKPWFVIQRHDATRLHFDFRLEIDGVLVSWSVPKGPSLNPADKRLAIRTEDHPLDYRTFEGVIPQGNYGGGTVIVWDTGNYEDLNEEGAKEALRKGHLRFTLHGEKLIGRFALTRTRYQGKQEQWLLIKKDDETADRRRKPAVTELSSVLTGVTNEDLKG